jgi:hypothetical protein
VASKNPVKGLVTLVLVLYFMYFVHYESHVRYNFLTALHHYHHANDNWLSYWAQVLMEITFPVILLPFYYWCGGAIFADPWVIFFSVVFYTTVHNVNYGVFRVNDVHALHHKDVFTNIGPDIFDVAFRTKNAQSAPVENTNHYLPNIVVAAVLTLLSQYLCTKNESLAITLFALVRYALVISLCLLALASAYVFCILGGRPLFHSEFVILRT